MDTTTNTTIGIGVVIAVIVVIFIIVIIIWALLRYRRPAYYGGYYDDYYGPGYYSPLVTGPTLFLGTSFRGRPYHYGSTWKSSFPRSPRRSAYSSRRTGSFSGDRGGGGRSRRY